MKRLLDNEVFKIITLAGAVYLGLYILAMLITFILLEVGYAIGGG